MRSIPKQSLRPIDCKSECDVLALNTSHKSSGDFSLLIQHDGAAIFTEQKPFQKPAASIIIPRRVFLKMMEWYETPQSR